MIEMMLIFPLTGVSITSELGRIPLLFSGDIAYTALMFKRKDNERR